MISSEAMILAVQSSALLYAIAKTAFINARIIALLDFTPQFNI